MQAQTARYGPPRRRNHRSKPSARQPWEKERGRPRSVSLREAIVIACGYERQNIIEEVWAEIFDTSQPVISAIITNLTPLIDAATEEDRPTAEEAKEIAARERSVLVDGFLAPTWSWRNTPELWFASVREYRIIYRTRGPG